VKKLELAIKKELNREYLDAVELYEEEIQQNCNASIDAYINLGFLYWEFAAEQIAFNDPNDISDKWSNIGGERYPKIITQGLEQYPKSVELHFWKKYFSHRLFCDNFTQEECEAIVKEYGDDESLVPYFFLYIFDNDKYRDKRDELRKQCEELLTAKNRYILSFN